MAFNDHSEITYVRRSGVASKRMMRAQFLTVLTEPGTPVEGVDNPRPCLWTRAQMLPCLLYLRHCRHSCKDPPCHRDECAPPPILCCLRLGMIARQITSDLDARRLCSCIKDRVVNRNNSSITGADISSLPEACLIDIKIPRVTSKTNCSKYVKTRY
ncbi:hypothetical protein OSB04_un001119 [Centaurea solstitialis]|uniref:Bifunctional inhibitor/plant lipid transfer protein/seed storage helical domain-containing protein n=1 Tax=Centaurea solstitialis TaxID=347529 RepID=A0AA38VUW4_9ASTR|nr:hypothetical protein OSB04_un001119 [Centaurea solstitialis]